MNHTFLYENGKITVTGVKALDSFDEKEVKIRLEDNGMLIKGSSFVLLDMILQAEKVSFQGNLSSMEYTSKGEKSTFFKKIFR